MNVYEGLYSGEVTPNAGASTYLRVSPFGKVDVFVVGRFPSFEVTSRNMGCSKCPVFHVSDLYSDQLAKFIRTVGFAFQPCPAGGNELEIVAMLHMPDRPTVEVRIAQDPVIPIEQLTQLFVIERGSLSEELFRRKVRKLPLVA